MKMGVETNKQTNKIMVANATRFHILHRQHLGQAIFVNQIKHYEHFCGHLIPVSVKIRLDIAKLEIE